jgi:hypothetical protein
MAVVLIKQPLTHADPKLKIVDNQLKIADNKNRQGANVNP